MNKAIRLIAAATGAALLLAGCGPLTRPASVSALQEDLDGSSLERTGVEVGQSGDVFEGFELWVWVYIDEPTTSTASVEEVLQLAAPHAEPFDTVSVTFVQGEPGATDYGHVPLDEIGEELDLYVDTGTVIDQLYAPPKVLAEMYGD